MYDFAQIKRLDPEIYKRAKDKADEKFGSKNSYVKNLYINNLYKKMGGKSAYPDKKPSDKKIQQSIGGEVFKELFKAEAYNEITQSLCDQCDKDELWEDVQNLNDFIDDEDIENYLDSKWSEDKSIASKEKKTLNKPFRTPGGPKKFSVYVKNDKGNVVKVNFGDPNMKIKRDDPNRRKSFRARHNCDSNPGPRWKARYWSCRQWRSNAPVEGSESNIRQIYPELKHSEEDTEFSNCGCN